MNPNNQWPAQGVYHNLPESVYFAEPASDQERIVSKSTLWHFAKNPKRWLKRPPFKVTDYIRWGRMIDIRLARPDDFERSYVVAPEEYPSDKGMKPWTMASNWCKDWTRKALSSGMEIVTKADLEASDVALAELQSNTYVGQMMAGDAKTQVAMVADINSDSVPLKIKGLIDIVPDRDLDWGNHLIDLKTIGKMDTLKQIEWQILDFGYHMQAALYLDLWNLLTGEDRNEFAFIFQLSEPPYEVAIVELSQADIDRGRAAFSDAIALWSQCITTGRFPSPFDGILTANIPNR